MNGISLSATASILYNIFAFQMPTESICSFPLYSFLSSAENEKKRSKKMREEIE